jgi:hypothetical protein
MDPGAATVPRLFAAISRATGPFVELDRIVLFRARAVRVSARRSDPMRRVFLVTAATLMAAAMSAGVARAQTIQLAANMAGSNETPGVLTGANAMAIVTLNPDRTVTYQIQVFNMPSGTTQGHFHVGGNGLAGPIVVDIVVPPTISNDFALNGSVGPSNLRPRPEQGINTWEDFLQSLVGGQTYLNLHSQINPAGEIRGQVLRVP